MTAPPRYVDPRHLHPRFLPIYLAVADDVEHAGLPFEPFELWRSPERQRWALSQKTTMLDQWQSRHQHGLACDFVGRDEGGRWSWSDDLPWGELGRIYARNGLTGGFDWGWDFPHGELNLTNWRRLMVGKWHTRDVEWLGFILERARNARPHIGWLQRQLRARAREVGDIDGAFGPQTERAASEECAHLGIAWQGGMTRDIVWDLTVSILHSGSLAT